MKKMTAIIMIVAMLAAIMPVSMALTSLTGRDIPTHETTAMSGLSMQTEVNKKYHTASESIELTGVSKGSYADLQVIGLEEIPMENADSSGYWLTSDESQGLFIEVDDVYDGKVVYGQRFAPVVKDGSNTYFKQYYEGETVWFNYDLYSDFNNGSLEMLPDNESGYSVECMCFVGALQPNGQSIDFQTVGSYKGFDGSISIKLTAPEDDTFFMFVIFIDETQTLDFGDFGAWLTISMVEENCDFKNVEIGEDMEVGTPISTDVGPDSDAGLVVAPVIATDFAVTYAIAHKIELEGGKHYVADFFSAEDIGARIWFCDENMDVLADTFIHKQLVQDYGYADRAMIVWPTESGSYYMVVGGCWTTDVGSIELEVMEWEDYPDAPEIPEVNVTIDLNDLGEEDYVSPDDNWEYIWYDDDEVGGLHLATVGTYTLQGEAPNTIVDIDDGIRVIYDNATTGAVRLMNTVAPITLEMKGDCYIEDSFIGTAISNYDALCSSGLYITGDNLTAKSMFGIVMENSPIHILTERLVVDTTSQTGYYPIGMWIVGINLPDVTIRDDSRFNGNNRLSNMYYDETGYFRYGYTVAEYNEVYRPAEANPGWDDASLYFQIAIDGAEQPTPPPTDNPTPPPTGEPTDDPTPPPTGEPTDDPTPPPTDEPTGDPDDAITGDANGDGKVNTGDATAVLRHAAGLTTLEGQKLANADANGDGKVNTGDATIILRFAAGIITEL